MIHVPFLEWLKPDILIGGDWRFFYPQNLKEIISYSYAWDQSLNSGLGQSNIIIIWLNVYLAIATYIVNHVLLIPWNIAEKIIFFWPIIICSFFSAFFLSRNYFRSLIHNAFAGIIYLTNTYALMIFAGGQVGIALAYSLVPFLVLISVQFLDLLQKNNIPRHLLIRKFLFVTLAFSLETLFEPRILLLALMIVVLYTVFSFFIHGSTKKRMLFFFAIGMGFLMCLLHSFWVLPLLLSPGSISVGSLGGSANVHFLSFANFSDSMSLLHPNWPENIFGKIQFMRPEFLLIPILSYGSIFFVHKKNTRSFFIIFFCLLGLFGAFMAKGTNPPFGQIYETLSTLPGFVAYRDPTKWYMLIALSYSMLLPAVFYEIARFVLPTKEQVLKWIIVPILFFWLFSIRQAFVPGLTGTFTHHIVPSSYTVLAAFLENQPEYFRTLWIPQVQRFGYFSNNHPAAAAPALLKTTSLKDTIAKLKDPRTEAFLKARSIKYIIVPDDTQAEIFLEDRKYSNNIRTAAITEIEKISWLKREKSIGKILLFEVRGYKDHIWTIGNSTVSWERVNPSLYDVTITRNAGGRFVLTESYSPGWKAVANGREVPSDEYMGMNAFDLTNVDGNFRIEFLPQRWVDRGYMISAATLVALCIGIVVTFFNKYFYGKTT